MKRIAAMFCLFGFIIGITWRAGAGSGDFSEEPKEQTIICDATLEDNFEEGTILVVLKKNATVINKKHHRQG